MIMKKLAIAMMLSVSALATSAQEIGTASCRERV